MNPDISIVVPVYNTETYLRRCVDSLLGQTHLNIEIILVDDGSPDSAGELCDEYAEQDNRVVVIHQENKGLSAARNTGINAARGRYLLFVDSDDYVSPDLCRLSYRAAVENKAEIVIFRYLRIRGKEKTVYPDYCTEEKALTHKEAMWLDDFYMCNPVRNKLFSSRLFDDIDFPEGKLYEDIGASYRLVHEAKGWYFIPDILYYYCAREGSIVTVVDEKSVTDLLEMSLRRAGDLRAWGYSETEDLEKFAALYYLTRLGIHRERSEECMDIIRKYRRNNRCLTFKQKCMAEIGCISERLFQLICILTGKKCG